MPLAADLHQILVCPTNRKPLRLHDQSLISSDEASVYPIINGVPWLLPNPRNSLVDWGAKLNHFNQVLLSEIKSLEKELKHAHGATQTRLALLLNGKRSFIRRVSELLFPVVGAQASTQAAYDALRDKAPHLQNLLSYEANLYRDWVWGEEENTLAADIINARLGDVVCGKIAVLGAGAGRLALDIYQHRQPDMLVATDINPLLVMAAEYLLSGESLNFYEFPLQPRKTEFAAVEHTIKGQAKPENFYFVFSDASKPCFKSGIFDVVVTPWLIDIQPFELGRFLKHLNQYLPEGGTWINFGSLVFNQRRDALCYSIEEVKDIAKKQGFEIGDIRESEIPYLKSPYNAGYRIERVWSWSAKKIADIKAPNSPQVLPNWILDDKQPVPTANYFQQFSHTHRIYAQLAAEIDGKTSLSKITKKFSRQNKMDEEEASQLVKNFFIDLYQQNT